MRIRTCGTMLTALALAGGGFDQAVAQRAISTSDRASGAKAHPQLLEQFGGSYAGPQSDYVRRVGQRIAVQSGLSNAQGDFTVTLLNSSVNNAFAVPGGYVYVTRQLLALMNDEAELAAVMGHEVGHVAAQHARSRSQRSTIASVLAGVVGAVAGNGTIGSLLGRGVGLGAQLYTLSFSRKQETEADDLGIRYLTPAGYDPLALSTMLGSLAAQNALDARLAGKASSGPSWTSTHPDPAARVARAAQTASRGGTTGGPRNRDAFLNAINGMVYDDDPQQGVIEGQTFRHPALRVAFTAPAGYALTNGASAVTISGNGGQAQFSGGTINAGLDSYVDGVFQALAGQGSLQRSDVQRTRVNGLDAAYASARANTQNGAVDVGVFAYAFDARTAYHFITITPAGRGTSAFESLFGSLRRLTPAEAANVRARRVQVVTVKAGDTVASLSARMAYPSQRVERFTVLNAVASNATLRPGQRVKLITYG